MSSTTRIVEHFWVANGVSQLGLLPFSVLPWLPLNPPRTSVETHGVQQKFAQTAPQQQPSPGHLMVLRICSSETSSVRFWPRPLQALEVGRNSRASVTPRVGLRTEGPGRSATRGETVGFSQQRIRRGGSFRTSEWQGSLQSHTACLWDSFPTPYSGGQEHLPHQSHYCPVFPSTWSTCLWGLSSPSPAFSCFFLFSSQSVV